MKFIQKQPEAIMVRFLSGHFYLYRFIAAEYAILFPALFARIFQDMSNGYKPNDRPRRKRFLQLTANPKPPPPPKKQKLTDTAKAAAKMLCDSFTFLIPLPFFQALHNSAGQIPMRQLHIPPDRTHRPLLHLFRQEAYWTVM